MGGSVGGSVGRGGVGGQNWTTIQLQKADDGNRAVDQRWVEVSTEIRKPIDIYSERLQFCESSTLKLIFLNQ